jgi:hypothetical protein
VVFHVVFSCELEEHLGLRATRAGAGGARGGGVDSQCIDGKRQALFGQGGGGEAVKVSQGGG